ncbi:MAG: OmpA family protein [Alphaproteobacteria bacterium]
MARSLRTIALIALAALSLSACTYFDDPEAGFEGSAPPPDRVDITNKDVSKARVGPVTTDTMPLAQSPDKMAMPSGPLPNYGDVTRKATSGSVEIYLLDGPVPASAGALPVRNASAAQRPLSPAGKGIAVNKSVEIFPLDGRMNALMNGSASPSSMNSSFPSASTAIIYYAHGSSSLSAADRQLISSLAQSAKSSTAPVRVEGHASVQSEIADPVMRKVANLKVSMDRAFKVAEELMQHGVPGDKIETKAYGEERPPANIPGGKDNDSAARRVEIYGLPENR